MHVYTFVEHTCTSDRADIMSETIRLCEGSGSGPLEVATGITLWLAQTIRLANGIVLSYEKM